MFAYSTSEINWAIANHNCPNYITTHRKRFSVLLTSEQSFQKYLALHDGFYILFFTIAFYKLLPNHVSHGYWAEQNVFDRNLKPTAYTTATLDIRRHEVSAQESDPTRSLIPTSSICIRFTCRHQWVHLTFKLQRSSFASIFNSVVLFLTLVTLHLIPLGWMLILLSSNHPV